MSGRGRGGRGAAVGHTRPSTYEELRAVLGSGTVSFPPRLRQVAIFLWQHPAEVALGSISQVARQAAVQPSTLVRFAQLFGFSGFTEFQNLFKEHLKGLGPEAGPPDAPEQMRFLNGFVAASQTSLARLSTLDRSSFEGMAEVLANAVSITLIGSKRAFPVTAYLSLSLSQLGVRNALVDNVGSSASDLVACLGAGDAVLAVSFSPYNSITPELVQVAHDRGATIVAVTDSALSPLVPLCRHWVEVVEPDFAGFRPLAASLAVGIALVHAVAARRRRVES